jgi:hypothetical protein
LEGKSIGSTPHKKKKKRKKKKAKQVRLVKLATYLPTSPTYQFRHLPTHLTYLPVPSLSSRREVLRPRPSSSSPRGSALVEKRRFPGLAKSIGVAAAARAAEKRGDFQVL